MKKAFAVFTLLLGLISMFAQSGPTFPYQAVVRNSQNQLIKDSTFAIGVEVYQGADLKYSETQSVTTNANGQFTMNIGGGTVVSGAMNDVTDWSVAKFKLTYHLSEGDIVSENAVSPVPYALQAANVAESAGLDCADVKTCIADTLTHYTTTTALEQLLQQISARMDSLDHIVDSLSHQPCGASFTCGTDSVKDIDNNWYHTVPFGNQCWLKENLRTTKYADNTPIENGTSSSTDTPYWYYPNNDASNKSSYGLLYNWKAVMNGASTTNDNPSGVQGICPSGWHVPSDAEWTQLTRFVKSQPAYVCAGCSGSDNDSFTYCIAKALASTTGWDSDSETCVVGDTTRSNNATGFSAMPAGYYDGDYSFFSSYTCFWSTTEDFNSYPYGRAILTYHNYVDRQFYNEASGFSVRCVRNADAGGNTPATPPTMSCEDVMNCLGDTLGNLNAQIESQGTEIQTLNATVASQGETIAAQGAEIETLNSTVTTQGETIAAQGETITAQGNTIDSLNHVVDSLSNLNHGGGTAAFTCGTSKVKDVENNEYNTVQIGSQCWMAQNLRTKTHQYGNVWTKTDADSAIYGRYYDWAAVMQGESGSTVQGICPAGWHVPSDAEWDTLTTYVSSVEAYKCNSSIASALSDSTGWKSSSICCAGDNSSATINITGFAAVPAGSFTDGFGGFGSDAYFWSATEYNNQMALCQSLHSLATGVSSYEDYKSHCYSVRCVRNADAGGDTPATPPTMSCEDVMNCLGDTLDRLNARITSQGAEIETLNGTVASQGETITAQANTIDSLNHIVDSLANPAPDTPASDTTAGPFNCGTDKVKDVDSNEYNTIQIGNQCWMKENLRTVTSHCGRVMNANDICLYDWAAAMQVSEANATTITVGVKHQGICPAGWHVPSDADWDALTSYVYNSTNPDYKCSGCNQGTEWEQDTRCIAKALSSTTGWNTSSNSCAVGNSPEDNDATGFSAVPAGAYYGESFGVTNVGTGAYMWSSTQKGDEKAWYRLLGCGNSRVVRSSSNKGICYSVRCVRNADAGGDTPATPPTMSCEDVMNCLGDTLDRLNARITSQGAEIETLNGTVASQGETIAAQGETIAAQGNAIDSLNHIVDSLSNLNHGGGTPAEVADGQPCPGAATVSDADGNTYNTVKIGSQCWMKENLRTMPRTGRSWSPGGDVSKVDDYGLLYDWEAVMMSLGANTTEITVNDKYQGICPNGWHVPSQAEWETLSHYTFDNYRCTDCEEIDPIWQSDLAYCVAKALCSAAWNDGGSSCNANSNAIGKNVTGFSILPAGARFGETPGSFGANTYFWSSTQHNGTTANSWFLGAFASSLNSYTDNKPAGLSLRCIRD